jgi:hypothetical protein
MKRLLLVVLTLLLACTPSAPPPSPTASPAGALPEPSRTVPKKPPTSTILAETLPASTPAVEPDTPQPVQEPIPLNITELNIVTPDVQQYERFEVQFQVDRKFQNPDWPYDANPPPGIQPGAGISVDALFSADGWQTLAVQTAFYYQPFQIQAMSGKDHYTPSGGPRWAVRFAPQQPGAWEYRLRVTDAAGTGYYPDLNQPALQFSVGGQSTNPYTRQGFLHVSASDARYFEFQDGTPFIGAGFNTSFHSVQEATTKMSAYEQNKINFIRVWLSGASINGSHWTSWASHHIPFDGYLPGVSLDLANTFPGSDVALRLDSQNPCLFADFTQNGIAVQPSTTYRLAVRLRLQGVTGLPLVAEPGFVVKQASWLDKACTQANNGTYIIQPVAGTTGWIELEGRYTTRPGMYWLDNLYLALENTLAGAAYIDEVRLWQEDDPNSVNLLRDPKADSHNHFDPINATRWDQIIQSAEQHGVYLKLVIDEKNEWIRNHIGLDGKMTEQADNDLFYAAPGSKVRWLQQAWWRYLVARWGYSTAIHSFEYVNEGDPYNGKHYEAVNTLAGYIHQADPARHMVTTSFWHSFPNAEFWFNPAYSQLDYADLHVYVSPGEDNTLVSLDERYMETDPAHAFSAPAAARLPAASEFREALTPRGLVIRGQGEWIIQYQMKAEGFTADCSFDSTGGMQRLRWVVEPVATGQKRENVVPASIENQEFICTSPAGSFDWQPFRSDLDRDGNMLSAQSRLILPDDQPYSLMLYLENSQGLSGTAWIDDIEVINPQGQLVPILGYFDLTPMNEDTAWFNRAYATLWGAGSPIAAGGSTGAGKPLVRGEVGVVSADQQSFDPDLLLDTHGIWLHNNIWAQASPGGVIDLFWWEDELIPPRLYFHYLNFRSFMQGIPINNGHYQDALAQTSHPNLRAWGQRDDQAGSAHLWIQNTEHTWRQVVDVIDITPIQGAVILDWVPAGPVPGDLVGHLPQHRPSVQDRNHHRGWLGDVKAQPA